MKSIVKMIEVVLASILMLTFVYAYFTIQTFRDQDWNFAINKIKTFDIINSLYINGSLKQLLKDGKFDSIENITSQLLPINLGFRYTIKNIPNNIIHINCVCNEDQEKRLEDMLLPLKFNFKNRTIEIRIKNSSDIDTRAEINFFFGYENYTLTYEQSIVYLRGDKSLFLFSDIIYTQDGILDKIFGLQNKTGDASPENVFYSVDNVSVVAYKISDYFSNTYWRLNTTAGPATFYIRRVPYQLDTDISNGIDVVIFNGNNYTENETFVVDGYTLKVYKVDGNKSTIIGGYREYADIGILNKTYVFNDLIEDVDNLNKIDVDKKTIVKSLNNFSAAKVNVQITEYGKGRTVWVADYDEVYSDFNQLLKSLILWASGERFSFGSSPTGRYATSPFFLYESGNIYVIEFSVWPLF